MAKPYRVAIHLFEAVSLRIPGKDALPSPYAVITVFDKQRQSTIARETNRVMWNKSFIFSELFLTDAQFDRAQILIDIKSANVFSRHDRIGYSAIGLREVADQTEHPNQILDEWVPLMSDEDTKPTGLVRVTVTVLRPGDSAAAQLMRASVGGTDGITAGQVTMPTAVPPRVAPPVYDLSLNVIRGQFLARTGQRYGSGGTGADMSAYIVLRFGATAVATRPVWHSSAPPFNSSLHLPVYDIGHTDRISVELWHSRGGFGSDQLIATHTVSFAEVSREARPPHWVNLYGPPLDTGTTLNNTFGQLLNPFHEPGVPLSTSFLGRILIGVSAKRVQSTTIRVEPLRPVPPAPSSVVTVLPLRVIRVEGVDPGLFGGLSVEISFGPIEHTTLFAPPASRNRHGTPVVWFTQPLTKAQQKARAESLDAIRKRMMHVRTELRGRSVEDGGLGDYPGSGGRAYIKEDATEAEVEAVRKKIIARDVHDAILGGMLLDKDGNWVAFSSSVMRRLRTYLPKKSITELERLLRRSKHSHDRAMRFLDTETRLQLSAILEDAQDTTDEHGPPTIPIPFTEADEAILGDEVSAQAASADLTSRRISKAKHSMGDDREIAERMRVAEAAENADDPYDALPDHTLITRDLPSMLAGADDSDFANEDADGRAEAAAARLLSAAGGHGFVQAQVPDVLINVYSNSFPHGRKHVAFARIPASQIVRPIDENAATAPRILPQWIELHRPTRPSRERQRRAWSTRVAAASASQAAAMAAAESGGGASGSGSKGAGAEVLEFDDALSQEHETVVGRIELQVAIVQKSSLAAGSAVALPKMPRPTQIDPGSEASRVLVSTLLRQEIESMAQDYTERSRVESEYRDGLARAVMDGLPDPRFEWDPRGVLDSQFQELAVVVYQARGLPTPPRVIATRFATPVSAQEVKNVSRRKRAEAVLKRMHEKGGAASGAGAGADGASKTKARMADHVRNIAAIKGGLFVEVLSDYTRPVRTSVEPSVGPSPVWYTSFLLPVFVPTESVSSLLLRVLRRVRRLHIEERRLREQLDVAESELRSVTRMRRRVEREELKRAAVFAVQRATQASGPSGMSKSKSALAASGAGVGVGATASHLPFGASGAAGFGFAVAVDADDEDDPEDPSSATAAAAAAAAASGRGRAGDPTELADAMAKAGSTSGISVTVDGPRRGGERESKEPASATGKEVRFGTSYDGEVVALSEDAIGDGSETAALSKQLRDLVDRENGAGAASGASGNTAGVDPGNGSGLRGLRGTGGAAHHQTVGELAAILGPAESPVILERAREQLLRERVDRIRSRLQTVSGQREKFDRGLTDIQAHRLIPLPAGIRLRVVMGSPAATSQEDVRVLAEVQSSDVLLSSKPRWAPLTTTTPRGIPVSATRPGAATHAGELLCWLTYDWRITSRWHDAQALLVDAIAASSRPGTLRNPLPHWTDTTQRNPDSARQATFLRLMGHAQRRGVLRQSTALRLSRQAQPWLPNLRPYRLDATVLGLRSLMIHARVNHASIRDADAPRYRIVIEVPDLSSATLGNGSWTKAQVDPVDWIKAGAKPLDQVPCFGDRGNTALGGSARGGKARKGLSELDAPRGHDSDSDDAVPSEASSHTTRTGLGQEENKSDDGADAADGKVADAAADEEPEIDDDVADDDAYYFAESTDSEDSAMDPQYDGQGDSTDDDGDFEDGAGGKTRRGLKKGGYDEEAERLQREELQRRVEEQLRREMEAIVPEEEEDEEDEVLLVAGEKRTSVVDRWTASRKLRAQRVELASQRVAKLARKYRLPPVKPVLPGGAKRSHKGTGVTVPVYICCPSALHNMTTMPRKVRTFVVEGTSSIPETDQVSTKTGARRFGKHTEDEDEEEEEEEEEEDEDDDDAAGVGKGAAAAAAAAAAAGSAQELDGVHDVDDEEADGADDTGKLAGRQIEADRANLMRSSPQLSLHMAVGGGLVTDVNLLRFLRTSHGVPLLCGPRLGLAEALWGLGLVRRPKIAVSVIEDKPESDEEEEAEEDEEEPAIVAPEADDAQGRSKDVLKAPTLPEVEMGQLFEVVDPLQEHTRRLTSLQLAEEDEHDGLATMRAQIKQLELAGHPALDAAKSRLQELEAAAWAAKAALGKALAEAEPIWLPSVPGYCPDATVYIYREYAGADGLGQKAGITPDSLLASIEDEPGASLAGLQAFVEGDNEAPFAARAIAQEEQIKQADAEKMDIPSIRAGEKRSWVLVGLSMLPLAPLVEAQAGNAAHTEHDKAAHDAREAADQPGGAGSGAGADAAGASGLGASATMGRKPESEPLDVEVEDDLIDTDEQDQTFVPARVESRDPREIAMPLAYSEAAVDPSWQAPKAVAVAMRSSIAEAGRSTGDQNASLLGLEDLDQDDEDEDEEAEAQAEAEAAGAGGSAFSSSSGAAASALSGLDARIHGGLAGITPKAPADAPPATSDIKFDRDDVDDDVPLPAHEGADRIRKAFDDVRELLITQAGVINGADALVSRPLVSARGSVVRAPEKMGSHPTPGPDAIDAPNTKYADQLAGAQLLALRAQHASALGLPIGDQVTPRSVWRWLEDRPSVPHLWSDAVERLMAQKTLQAAGESLAMLEKGAGNNAAETEALREDLDDIEGGKYADLVDDVLFTAPTGVHQGQEFASTKMPKASNPGAAQDEAAGRRRKVEAEIAAAGVGGGVQRVRARDIAQLAVNISPEQGAEPGPIEETEGEGGASDQGWDLVKLLRMYRLRTQDGGDGTRHTVRLKAAFDDLSWLNPPMAALLWVGITRSALSPEAKARAHAVLASRGRAVIAADGWLTAPGVGSVRFPGVLESLELRSVLQAQLPWFEVGKDKEVYDRYGRALEHVFWMNDGCSVVPLWMPSVPSIWSLVNKVVKGSAMMAPSSVLSFSTASVALAHSEAAGKRDLRRKLRGVKQLSKPGDGAVVELGPASRPAAGRHGDGDDEDPSDPTEDSVGDDGDNEQAAGAKDDDDDDDHSARVASTLEFREDPGSLGAGGIIMAPFTGEGEMDAAMNLRWANSGDLHCRFLLSPSADVQRPLDVLEDTLYDLDAPAVAASMLEAVDRHVMRTVESAALTLQGAYRLATEANAAATVADGEGGADVAGVVAMPTLELTEDDEGVWAMHGSSLELIAPIKLASKAASSNPDPELVNAYQKGRAIAVALRLARRSRRATDQSIRKCLVVIPRQELCDHLNEKLHGVRVAQAKASSTSSRARAASRVAQAQERLEEAELELDLAMRAATRSLRKAVGLLNRIHVMLQQPPLTVEALAAGSSPGSKATSAVKGISDAFKAMMEALKIAPIGPEVHRKRLTRIIKHDLSLPTRTEVGWNTGRNWDTARVLLGRAPWLQSAVDVAGPGMMAITRHVAQYKPSEPNRFIPVEPRDLVRKTMIPAFPRSNSLAYQHVHVQVIIQRGDGITMPNGATTRPYVRVRVVGPGKQERQGHFVAYQSVGGAGSLKRTPNPVFGAILAVEAWIPGRCELIVDVMRPAAAGIAAGVERGVVLGSTHIDLERRWRCLTWRQMLETHHSPMETRQLLPQGAAADALATTEETNVMRRASELASRSADASALGSDARELAAIGAGAGAGTGDVTAIVHGPHARAKMAGGGGIAAPLSRGSLTMTVSLTPWSMPIRAHPLAKALTAGQQKFELRVVVWNVRQRRNGTRIPVYVTGEVIQPAEEEAEESSWDWLPAGDFAIAQQTMPHPGMVGVGDDKSILEFNWRMKFEVNAPVTAHDPFVVAPRLRMRAFEDRPFYAGERVLSEAILELGPLIREAAEALTTKVVEKTEVSLKAVMGEFGSAGKLVMEASLVPAQDALIRDVGFGRDEPNRDPYLRKPILPDQRSWLQKVLPWLILAILAIVGLAVGLGSAGG